MKIAEWIKTHKLIVLFAVVILYLWNTRNPAPTPFTGGGSTLTTPQAETGIALPDFRSAAKLGTPSDTMIPPTGGGVAPVPEVKNRMVISDSYMSLLVSNVVDTQKKILETVEGFGGYMVNTYLQNPQDAPTSNVTIRIPSKNLPAALDIFRKLAVKVVTENLQGEDVTDQFVDNEARLATLMKTKAKFEEILDKAVNVQDILTVQREIINLQSQIDAVRGQQKFLEKSAEMAKITIYLSTDELALPYAPSDTWRPAVIFKQAVRSLIITIRGFAEKAIWLAVYSVIWIPTLLIGIVLWRRFTR